MAEAGTSYRLRRELKTVRLMIELHCRRMHETRASNEAGPWQGLCEDCEAVWAYTRLRIENCQFCADKPTCANCTVHCFKPTIRESIRQIMRYAGPRMLWRHPYLAIMHLLDGRRPAPPPPLRKGPA